MTAVRVVLDTSALLAYCRLDGVSVGELLMLVEEDGGLTGVPATCAVSAYADLVDEERARLVRLITDQDSAVVVLPLLGADVVTVAQAAARVPPRVGGQAVFEAGRRDATLATYAGDAARTVLGAESVLDL